MIWNKKYLCFALSHCVIKAFTNEYVFIMFKEDKLNFYTVSLFTQEGVYFIGVSYCFLPIPQVVLTEEKLIFPSLIWVSQPSQNNSW